MIYFEDIPTQAPVVKPVTMYKTFLIFAREMA